MPRTNYQKGADKERRIVNKWRDENCLAFRSAGSHSQIDIFVLDPFLKIIHLIQSKPKSMSDNKKNQILQDLKKFEGRYRVLVSVE